MGRKGVDLRDERRWVFNRLAADYRARPAYPAAVIDHLARLAGPGSTVVDIGAGTGLLAVALAERGLRVIAVEPARAMLDVLREVAGREVVAVHATAEATGLDPKCAALAVVADALHWMDPAATGRELARVVAPGGGVAVVEPAFADTPFMRDVARLIAAANFKARRATSADRREHLLGAAGARQVQSARFSDAVALDGERLDAVLRSLSLVGPAIGPEALARLLEGARRAAEAHGGAIWARDIAVTWGRLR